MRRGQQPLHARHRTSSLRYLPFQAVVVEQQPNGLEARLYELNAIQVGHGLRRFPVHFRLQFVHLT
jgi:hypothetical protein